MIVVEKQSHEESHRERDKDPLHIENPEIDQPGARSRVFNGRVERALTGNAYQISFGDVVWNVCKSSPL